MDRTLNLAIIIGSTREGRFGDTVGRWFAKELLARSWVSVHGEFVIMPPWASEIIRDNVLSIDMTSASRTH